MIIQNILLIRNLRGILFGLLLIVLAQGVFAGETCTFVRMWGSYEGGSSITANGVAVDTSGNVYVTDPGNSRILQYSSDGSIITYWDLRDRESGNVGIPSEIAVDSAHKVYITDSKNNTIQKLTTRGSEVWGSEGTGDGQFPHPAGIAVDSSGNVYVADTGNNRIQKFHSTVLYLLKWGSYGTPDGSFNAPTGVTVDSSGNVYVADTGNKRIQKFSSSGTFLAKWGTSGTGDGQFSTPTGIAVDSWGNVYVADLTSRVQKFNPTGEYFTTCNTGGSTYDIALDPSGTMYALWQSGPVGKIGKYGTAVSIPTQNPPGQTHTFAITTRQTYGVTITPEVPTTSQNSAIPRKPPATATISLTTTPNASSATILSPAQTLNPGYDAKIAPPGNQKEGEVRKTDVQMEIFERISTFFREVVGVKINFSA